MGARHDAKGWRCRCAGDTAPAFQGEGDADTRVNRAWKGFDTGLNNLVNTHMPHTKEGAASYTYGDQARVQKRGGSF